MKSFFFKKTLLISFYGVIITAIFRVDKNSARKKDSRPNSIMPKV